MSDDEGGSSMAPEQVRHVRAAVAGPLLPTICSLLGLDRVSAASLLDMGAVYVEKVRVTSGDHDQIVPKDAYLRVHTNPRRFPVARSTDWPSRIVSTTPHFAVINKPGGVPVHATLDNAVEVSDACASEALAARLWALHRLDVPTHGLVVMGRTPGFTSHFGKLLQDRQVLLALSQFDLAP
ncbi:hypothetical protein T484DRAFT_2091593 [Baffinella frigidus]|nr:hypothetical protein T484DRAFT_2091593 [Cryptophyta sp. CCMP2293]